MKRSLSLLILAATLSTECFAVEFTVDGVVYNLLSVPDRQVEVGKADYKGNVVIPDVVNYNGRELDVVAIGEYAFRDCAELTGVSIGKKVKTIKKGAFRGTTSLKELSIPANVSDIEHYALNECGIETFVLQDADERIDIGNSDNWGESNKEDQGLFYFCPNLVTVYWGREYLNKSTPYQRKGEPPFLRNKTVKKVVFSGSGYPQQAMFSNSEALQTIEFAEGNFHGTIVDDSAFSYCNALESVSIPGCVMYVRGKAFEGCSNLKYVALEEGLKTLGRMCFSSTAVEEVTVPSSVTNISNYSFSNCLNLRSIVFYSNCPLHGVVNGCTNLETIVFGPATTIVDSPTAFSSCSALKDVRVQTSVPPQASDEFTDAQYVNAVLHVPTGSEDTYREAPVWKNFWSIVGDETGALDCVTDDAALSVYVSDGVLYVKGKNADDIVSVFSLTGELVARTADDIIFGLAPGCYVVTVEGRSYKVLIAR